MNIHNLRLFHSICADDLVNEGGIMDLGLEKQGYSNMVLEQDQIFLN